MVKMTASFEHWLWVNHQNKFGLIMLGHIELITQKMWDAYIEWCQTDEGKEYLEGGSKYRKVE